jgi:hypothetical protein
VDDRCEECGYDGRALSPAEVADRLPAVAAEVRDLVSDEPEERLRRRPDEGGWSALEYVLHLRDLTAYHRWLIEQALAHDEPMVPPVDPDAAVAGVDLDRVRLDEILAQYDRRVERLRALLVDLRDGSLARRIGRPAGDRVVDVRLVARSALHEAVHHRGDLERLLPPA